MSVFIDKFWMQMILAQYIDVNVEFAITIFRNNPHIQSHNVLSQFWLSSQADIISMDK